MQPREHDVPCRNPACRRPTWNPSAYCDRCGDESEWLYRRSEDALEQIR